MDSITYIILLKNQSKNIPALAESLQAIKGNIRKEFVIIDDCSSDDTAEVAREYFSSFPKCTILVNDEYHGPSYSINRGLGLSHGKYIQIIDGDQILDPYASSILLEACKVTGASVSCGLYGSLDNDGNKFKSSFETGDTIILDNPVKNLLDNSVQDIREFGYSATLISRYLLEEMLGVNEDLFIHNMSLALTCGKFSKFAFVKKSLAYNYPQFESRYDKKFIIQSNLQAIVYFMEDHRRLSENYTSELYKALWAFLWNLDKKHKVKSLPRYFLSRYMKKTLDLDTLIELYKGYIEQLDS